MGFKGEKILISAGDTRKICDLIQMNILFVQFRTKKYYGNCIQGLKNNLKIYLERNYDVFKMFTVI